LFFTTNKEILEKQIEYLLKIFKKKGYKEQDLDLAKNRSIQLYKNNHLNEKQTVTPLPQDEKKFNRMPNIMRCIQSKNYRFINQWLNHAHFKSSMKKLHNTEFVLRRSLEFEKVVEKIKFEKTDFDEKIKLKNNDVIQTVIPTGKINAKIKERKINKENPVSSKVIGNKSTGKVSNTTSITSGKFNKFKGKGKEISGKQFYRKKS